jgi:chromosome transmission fidelity protein 8
MAASSVTLHPNTTTAPGPSNNNSSNNNNNNPLPQLLQTPSGLALLELQGTINLPGPAAEGGGDGPQQPIAIGRLDFPDYRPGSITFDPSSTAWMKRAYMYVGQHQRLTGEVKKLPRAVGVVRRRQQQQQQEGSDGASSGGDDRAEELEVVEIVKYKIVFSSRPEPVGTA